MNDTFHFRTKITKVGPYNFASPTKRERFLGYPLVAGVIACIYGFNNTRQRFVALGGMLAVATTTQYITKLGPPPTTFLTPTLSTTTSSSSPVFSPLNGDLREGGKEEEDFESAIGASASVMKAFLGNLREEQDIWPTGDYIDKDLEETISEVLGKVEGGDGGGRRRVRVYERMGPYTWGSLDGLAKGGKIGYVVGVPEIWRCKTTEEIQKMCEKYTKNVNNNNNNTPLSPRGEVWETVFSNSSSFSPNVPPPPNAAPVSKEDVIGHFLPSKEEQKYLLALNLLELQKLSQPTTLFSHCFSLPLLVVGMGGLMSVCLSSTIAPVPLFFGWMAGTNCLTYVCARMGSDYRLKAQKEAIQLYPQGAKEYAERTTKIDDLLFPGTYNLQKYMILQRKKQFDQRRQIVTEENDVRKKEAKRLKKKIEPEKPRMRGFGEESRWLTMFYRPFFMFEKELVQADPSYTPKYYYDK